VFYKVAEIRGYDFYNANAVVSDIKRPEMAKKPNPKKEKSYFKPRSSTLETLFDTVSMENSFRKDVLKKIKKETLSRQGFKLVAPCQDVLGFLKHYAPKSKGEEDILNYLYTVHVPHDFVMRTQIMNEGWAMYWEKKIMLELFKDKAVTGIIDYARTFSAVCVPRPFFMRNPYHLGYQLWCHIEKLYKDGKVSLDYIEETDQKKKENWHRPSKAGPVDAMTHLVKTVTDYEFIRRFLTPGLIKKFYLNRLDKRWAKQLGLEKKDIIEEDDRNVYLDPGPVKKEMLDFFTNFQRPRIYVVDTDFEDGGLLLYFRNDKRRLRHEWIKPTLKNINLVWKGPTYLIAESTLYKYAANTYKETTIKNITFEQIHEGIRRNRIEV